MKLVMTLLVRNEADIIEEHIAYHLAAGVDFIVAADNGSTDGTTEVLDRFARDGRLHRIALADPFSQVEVVTELARLAATEFEADWVINSDADEFWWSRGVALKELLRAIPNRFGSVRGMWRNFVARPERKEPFAERMTIRTNQRTGGSHPFNPHFKTVHRASPEVEVGGGNHDVTGPGLMPMLGWYPIDVLHFPIRSRDHFERKFLRWWEITSVDGEASNPYYNEVRDAHREGRMADLYDPLVVNDDELRRGLADGTLVEDTRLRDALRALRKSPTVRLETEKPRIDTGYLRELGYIEENNAVLRAQQRIAALEARITRIERGLARRSSQSLRGGMRRMARRNGSNAG